MSVVKSMLVVGVGFEEALDHDHGRNQEPDRDRFQSLFRFVFHTVEPYRRIERFMPSSLVCRFYEKPR